MKRETNAILVPNDFGKLKPYCSDASIAYLKQSLVRLEKGTPPTPSFPLYGIRDKSVLKKLVDEVLSDPQIPQWLYEYELSRDGKFGSQGGVPAWEKLVDNFLLYKTALKPVVYVDADVLQEMVSDYRQLRCSALSAEDTLKHLIRTDKIQSRAAGWSEFQLKKTDGDAQKIALKYAKDGSWRHGYGYVFSRFNKQKLRIFMPMPFSSMILQAKWFIPFLGGIQQDLLAQGAQSPFAFWADKVGFERCFQIMEDEIQRANVQPDEYLVYFSNDFEKMDTRTGTEQYTHFFLPVLHAAFGNKLMDEEMLFTTTAPIISPSGTMEGDHGTASGAEVTNCGEGSCNDYFERRLVKVMHDRQQWRLISRKGNGDDGIMIFAVKKGYSLDQMEANIREALKQVSAETGFDVQTEKLEISDVFGKYCQHVLKYENGKLFWCYPISLVLNSIVNPEKEYTKATWDKDYRDIDIIEKLDNATHHPAYTHFVDWVMAGMKLPLLGKDEEETKRILSKYDKYRELQTLGERYNRQDYHISKSPTVNLVLSRRG